MNIQAVKNRYDIIGNDPRLDMAISKAVQVADTDLSILITGESGVGKDVFSQIVHDNSSRKHKSLVAVNCGAIPEGTIESELFGHIKGSFTGADKDRKGYFEEASGGTIFLDEVGELPLNMQVKLLRVLENGEIIPVGSSQARKVDVRVVAATNVDILSAVRQGRFREDLFYRLNQISVSIPPLRERKGDIYLLFRKFSSDVAEKYGMPPLRLTADAHDYLESYPWYGNIRELKNITEQIAVLETERNITLTILRNYLVDVASETMPALVQQGAAAISDRELLLKALSMGQMITEMRDELNHLRQVVSQLAGGIPPADNITSQTPDFNSISFPAANTNELKVITPYPAHENPVLPNTQVEAKTEWGDAEVVDDEPLSLTTREKLAIRKALDKRGGKRKLAAQDLGISERTLYRKIKEYGIE
ncbi:MAG: sigma 54-interacting transcriptional regulator [Bacteroidales bacterium]|nr:sigma 54-interacting transcriptional regulator [Bacteroidales bacterium]